MAAAEFADHLDGYAALAAVQTATAVHAVRRAGAGYCVETGRGAWQAGAVVIATGHCDTPAVPAIPRNLPGGVLQITPSGTATRRCFYLAACWWSAPRPPGRRSPRRSSRRAAGR